MKFEECFCMYMYAFVVKVVNCGQCVFYLHSSYVTYW